MKMTIHDELILELIKPDMYGKVGEKTLIVKIVGTRKIKYRLERMTYYWKDYKQPRTGIFAEETKKRTR